VRACDYPEKEVATIRLIEANLPLVVSVVERHSSQGVDMLDLIETGNQALMLALNTLPENPGGSFTDHAAACIERAVSKAIAESQLGTS